MSPSRTSGALVGAQLDHLARDVEIDDRRVAEILDQVDTRRQARRRDAQRRGPHAERHGAIGTERPVEREQVGACDMQCAAANFGRQQVHRRAADEVRDDRGGGPRKDFLRRADLHDAAFHEDGDAIGDRHRLFLVVRHIDGRDVQRALQLAQLDAGLQPQLASRFDSGSSSRNSRGLRTIARASAQRCCCPPESWPGRAREQMVDVHHRGRIAHRAVDSAFGVATIRNGKAMLSNTDMCG